MPYFEEALKRYNEYGKKTQLSQIPQKRSFDEFLSGSGLSDTQFPAQQPEELKKSLFDKINSFATGAGKSLISTFSEMSSLGQRGLEKTGLTIGKPSEQTAAEQIIPEELRTPTEDERAGFATGEIAQLLFPVGTGGKLATKAPKLVQLLAKSAVGSGEFAGKTALMTGGDKEKVIEAAAVGAVAPLAMSAVGAGIKGVVKGAVGTAKTIASKLPSISTITKPATKVSSYISSRFPKLLGIATGESNDVIVNAMKNTAAADVGARGGDIALRNAITQAADKSIATRGSLITSYAKAKEKIFENVGPLKAVNSGWVNKSFRDLLGKNKISISPDGKLDFTISKAAANPGEAAKINAAWDAIRGWKDWSASGVDDLKHLIGGLTKFANEGGGTSKSPTLGSFYHTLDLMLKKNLPENVKNAYTELNDNFSKNIELWDEIVDAFNSGDPFTRLANALGKNKDTMRQLVGYYEEATGESILPIVAGRELAMEKTAAFGFLNPRSWIDLLWSPESQASFVIKAGEKMSKVIPK